MLVVGLAEGGTVLVVGLAGSGDSSCNRAIDWLISLICSSMLVLSFISLFLLAVFRSVFFLSFV